ncbi:hypothetical protein SVI_0697 [Shewanella violacea DSS12]|uniref:Uncharacterized protein n=1 Tax=Shewanella violacea (strain JCM 10179 / CIP 106290 / LMG 19151 / DSS12) TaxID=637905 RepID=D4ZG69_SHEVD|nr:hypothetical protein SVI_0697 [Shewanella violacea DSS12]
MANSSKRWPEKIAKKCHQDAQVSHADNPPKKPLALAA